MISKKRKKSSAFDEDIKREGRYQYVNFEQYSIYIATKRQSEEIIRLLQKHTDKNTSILDVGCGDGTFTFELLREVLCKKMVGFDVAKEAIKVAQNAVTPKDKKKIFFQEGSIYDANKMFRKNSFDIIVVRGVLHHLENPERGIQSLSKLAKKIIVLEPNGYNPILKLIERFSQYHIEHEEKSYWPPTLNSWFIRNGYHVKEQKFFSIIPYFCPEPIAKALKIIQPLMEKIPGIKIFYCGTNLIYYEK